MQLSSNIIERWVREHWDSYPQIVHDWAHEYGEPGYHLSGETPMFLIGDWWVPKSNRRSGGELKDWGRVYPRLWAQLESQGVEMAFYDEWTVDHNTGKAYRTQPDSYSWESSIAYWDGEMMTPDDDFETWVQYALAEVAGLNSTQVPDLERKLAEAGFIRRPDEGDYFERGWHPGQTDDPEQIRKDLLTEHGPDTEIVFALIENSQFYYRFAAYYRIPESEEDE